MSSYYEQNKEKILARKKEYDRKNKEKISSYNAEYYKQNYNKISTRKKLLWKMKKEKQKILQEKNLTKEKNDTRL